MGRSQFGTVEPRQDDEGTDPKGQAGSEDDRRADAVLHGTSPDRGVWNPCSRSSGGEFALGAPNPVHLGTHRVSKRAPSPCALSDLSLEGGAAPPRPAHHPKLISSPDRLPTTASPESVPPCSMSTLPMM